MNKKIIKFWAIFIFILVLTGCVQQSNYEKEIIPEKKPLHQSSPQKEQLLQAIENAREAEKKVFLEIEKEKLSDQILIVKVILKNPQKLAISSVRSFISFNKKVLEGIKIDFPQESFFELTAPGEKEFDQENGLVKIGVSVAGQPIKEEEIIVAKITFKRLSKDFIILEFFNPPLHTKVLGIFKGKIKNILGKVKVPAFIFNE